MALILRRIAGLARAAEIIQRQPERAFPDY
jgi:hypothetical protein